MVRSYQNADCSIIKDFYPVNYYNFRNTFFPLCRPPKCAIERWFKFLPHLFNVHALPWKLKATKMAKLAVKKHLF